MEESKHRSNLGSFGPLAILLAVGLMVGLSVLGLGNPIANFIVNLVSPTGPQPLTVTVLAGSSGDPYNADTFVSSDADAPYVSIDLPTGTKRPFAVPAHASLSLHCFSGGKGILKAPLRGHLAGRHFVGIAPAQAAFNAAENEGVSCAIWNSSRMFAHVGYVSPVSD